MKDFSDQYLKEDDLFNRRKMLSILGIGGLSGTSALALTTSKTDQGKEEKGILYPCNNVTELKAKRSLQEGGYVETYGFYEVGDGGHALYRIVKSPQQTDEGEYIALQNGLAAQLIGVDKINYRMFGAKSDGQNDDGVQIKAAHAFANKYGLPVENLSGKFWIRETTGITIQTNVQWGQSAFYINERYNTNIARFRVSSRLRAEAIELTGEEKQSFLRALNAGDVIIPELAKYVNSLVVIIDNNDKIGARQGGSANQGKGKQDFFYVEEFGRVIGKVFLKFSDYTLLMAYPAEQSYLTVDGGTFFMSGDSSDVYPKKYMANGVQIQRSRTIIQNQWVGLEAGKSDISVNPRSGFYILSTVYDVQLRNIRLIPWEKNRKTKETYVPAGTYGISGTLMMNVLFHNIMAEAGDIHWGVFGTNYVKNLRLERCYLNRFDVHSFGWDITILDSEIGPRGITVTGGGDLRVENTICYDDTFVIFRHDYGSCWDGDVLLKNCRLYPTGVRVCGVLRYLPKDLDYKYDIGYGHKIQIEDVEINFKRNPKSDRECWILHTTAEPTYVNSGKLFFPSHIEVRNIAVKGRDKGVRIMSLSPQNVYRLDSKFVYNRSLLDCNAKLIFENIDLEDTDPDVSHLSFAQVQGELDDTSLVPSIRIKDCANIVCDLGGNLAELIFEDTRISDINLTAGEEYPGSLTFKHCDFVPTYRKDRVLKFDTVLGTSFIHCQLHLPRHAEKSWADVLKVYGFMEINKLVKFNHTHSRLSRDLLTYLSQNGIQLQPAFITKLKSHHELED